MSQLSIRESVVRCRAGVLAAALLLSMVSACVAADWPTYLQDNTHSGRTDATLAMPLGLQWTFTPHHAPKPAWDPPIPHEVEENLEVNRVDFDYAHHVTVVENRLYFGTSADDKIYCLDARSGDVHWVFYTGGPVRFAPTISEGRLYVGSDDGFVYCLDASSGALVWKKRLGPDGRLHLGVGRMISRWPVRTNVLVDDGIAYVGVGVFPHEGVFVAALDANTGDVVWKNDATATDKTNQSRFTPQGYLLASDELLFVPSGRDTPAAFSREDGTLKFQPNAAWRNEGIAGGTYAVLADDHLITGANQNLGFDAKGGKLGFAHFEGRRLVVTPTRSFMATEDGLVALDRQAYTASSKQLLDMRWLRDIRNQEGPFYLGAKAQFALRDEEAKKPEEQDPELIESLQAELARCGEILERMKAEEAEFEENFQQAATLWTVPGTLCNALVATENMLIAGGDGRVVAVDTAEGELLWETEIDGSALGLAVAADGLFVSTDTGKLYRFGAAYTGQATDLTPRRDDRPFAQDESTSMIEQAAESILEETGVTRGYCVVLGNETGRLAWEIAKRTELKVIGIEPDAEKVAQSRAALDKTGMYGDRITVLHADLDELPISNYCANLVVSENALITKKLPGVPKEWWRIVRPLGGVIALDGATASGVEKLDVRKFGKLQDGWALFERDALRGAGEWTQQYANAGNTASSDETRLRAPLGVLWYGEPGPTQMISRHAQATAPVSVDGRLFMLGDKVLLAYDAYNGVKLWEYSFNTVSHAGTRSRPGCLAASSDGVFLATGSRCFRFDPETGEVTQTYTLPKDESGLARVWNYLGLHNGILLGSASESIYSRFATMLFAIDTETHENLWVYRGKNVGHLTIAMADDRVFLVDSNLTTDQRDRLLRQDHSHLEILTGKAQEQAEAELKAIDLRLAVALDARSGEEIWTKPLDLTDCSGIHKSGGELTTMCAGDRLVFSGASGNGHFWKQFLAGEFSQRKLLVISAATGEELWAKEANYRIRPIVVGDQVIAEPWAFDLATGEQVMRANPISGEKAPWLFLRSGHHCGHVSASQDMLFFRSNYIAYYDMAQDIGTFHFSGQRPGCSVNMIPANGLLHIPEASAGCQCLHAIQCTVTLEPVTENRDWAIYAALGESLPVKHLAVNFGAPGDRRDSDGKLWIAYPRATPGSKTKPLAMDFSLAMLPNPVSAAYHQVGNTVSAGDAAPDWLFSGGCAAVEGLTIPTGRKTDKPGLYTVRLFFGNLFDSRADTGAEFGGALRGIQLQDETRECLIQMLDASGPCKVEFQGVTAHESLKIAFSTEWDLCGLELIRTGDASP